MSKHVVPGSRCAHALLFAIAACGLFGLVAAAQEKPQANGAPPSSAVPSAAELAQRQQKLGERFKKFEEILLRLAELNAQSDPRRAALLKKAIQQSKAELIALHFERAGKLLESDKLADSLATQGALKDDLVKLLDLLLNEQRNKQHILEDQLKRLNEIIKIQGDIQDRTRAATDPKGMAGPQGKVAQKADDLAKNMQPGMGKPGEAQRAPSQPNTTPAKSGEPNAGQPNPGQNPGEKNSGQPSPKSGKPGDTPGNGGNSGPKPADDDHDHDHPADDEESPGQKRIAAAQQKMKQAEKELEEARRDNALERQDRVMDDLRAARDELERALRQQREEEIERLLVMLEARFRRMLEMQVAVYEGTLMLDRIPASERGRNHEVEAGRLSRRESHIVQECNRVLQLLKEDGTAVAIPEAVGQVRDDMEMVVIRLAQDKVDPITQGVEEDIIAAIEEIIATLEKAQQPREPEPPTDGPTAPREPKKDPLVDTLAELKLIRTLQMRVNSRTQKFSKLVDDEQALKAELLEALDKLAEREKRIFRVTRDLSLGRNQ